MTTGIDVPTEEEAWTALAVEVLQVIAEILDRVEPDTQEEITRAVGIQAPEYLDHEGLLSRVQTTIEVINYNN